MTTTLRVARRQPLGALALAYLVALVVAGLLAPELAPYPPAEQDLGHVLGGPSAAHWLGTDTLGRDLLSRLLFGVIPSLTGVIQALVVFLSLGVTFGILAGYLGGWVDTIISRAVDLALSIPVIIMVLVVLAVFGASPPVAMVALGTLGSPGLVRVVRGSTLAVREELFVTAARVSGLRPVTIMRTHVLRRVAGPVLVQAALFSGIALVVQAALSYLGLLANGGHPTWGGMVGAAATVISRSAWPLLPPGLAIAVTVVAFGLVGDAVRDATADEVTDRPRARGRHPQARSGGGTGDAGTAPDGGAVLAVRGLTVAVADEHGTPLVTGVSLSVHRGETVALVGESGCGKTVTALATIGLLPAGVHLLEGEVRFGGRDLATGGQDAYQAVRGSGIAYISQDALASLDPTHTVGSHLREVIRRHERLSPAATRARAVELLDQVKLVDTERVLASYPHELSGGMAQRVNIALAVAGRPDLLIADEPTTALDVTLQAEILALLRELQGATGLAILLITHDWGVVADVAHRAVVMYAGEVVEVATVDTVFRAPRFPYTAALLAADPSTAPVGARLPTVPGRVPPPGAWPAGCRFAGRCGHVRPDCRSTAPVLRSAGRASLSRCLRVGELVDEGVLPS